MYTGIQNTLQDITDEKSARSAVRKLRNTLRTVSILTNDMPVAHETGIPLSTLAQYVSMFSGSRITNATGGTDLTAGWQQI